MAPGDEATDSMQRIYLALFRSRLRAMEASSAGMFGRERNTHIPKHLHFGSWMRNSSHSQHPDALVPGLCILCIIL